MDGVAHVSLQFFFFFSSRRRHTRCSRDWSSDVCSSDLDKASQNGESLLLLRSCPRIVGVDEDVRIDQNLSAHRARPASTSAWRGALVATVADRKSTRLNSSHGYISYAVFCLKKKKK